MPEFFFQRYVDGKRMADDVLITKQATLEDAIPAALRLCWNSPKSVLVYIPQTPWRDIESAPNDQIILVYDKSASTKIVAAFLSEGGWLYAEGFEADPEGPIPTHWVPLPEPPSND